MGVKAIQPPFRSQDYAANVIRCHSCAVAGVRSKSIDTGMIVLI
jgi:hypothetical protein